MEKEKIAALSRNIAGQIISEEKEEQNRLFDMSIWDWSQGVALFGLWKLYRISGEEALLDYLCSWFDEKIDEAIEHNINTMAPLLTLCFLYEETGKQAYLSYCEETAEWLTEELPRTAMGGFQHITIDAENEEQLWADTVFMAVLFLAKLADVSGNTRYADEAKKQLFIHIRYLADKKSGLWYHGWSFIRKDNFASALWARGNAWFSLAGAELPAFFACEQWAEDLLRQAWLQQMESLKALQSPEGLWHTLLDKDDSYTEVSASAGIAAAMLRGVRKGYLPASFEETALRAARAVIAHIGEDGMVSQVSYGTVVADNEDYYKKVPLRPTGYGQNLALIMLCELRRFYEEKNH